MVASLFVVDLESRRDIRDALFSMGVDVLFEYLGAIVKVLLISELSLNPLGEGLQEILHLLLHFVTMVDNNGRPYLNEIDSTMNSLE